MSPGLGPPMQSALFELALTLALLSGAAILLGGLASLIVFLYKSTKGDGMKDPRESDVVSNATDDDTVSKGDADDEWKYY